MYSSLRRGDGGIGERRNLHDLGRGSGYTRERAFRGNKWGSFVGDES